MQTLECTDRRGNTTFHDMPSELSPEEAAERLGILGKSWTIRAYPKGKPSEAIAVQTYRNGKITKGA